jgi:hypothetical protein
VLGHPATGQHGHAGDGQQPGQPGAGRQDLLLVLYQQTVRGGDVLPGNQARAAGSLAGVARRAGECPGSRRIVEPQVQEV